ncbi:MAG: MATE family efflux transporter [Eubacteriales bacterium]|nr:MATE family efflux transporter [Eubacteriales bacterium]
MKTNGQIIQSMFRKSLLVMIFSTITATIGMVVDGVIIGKLLGVDAMAAYGLAMPAFIVITAVGGILTSGVQALCAEKMAQGKMEEANQVFSMTCIAAIAFSLLLMVFLLPLSDPVAKLLGASGNSAYLLSDTSMYLRGLAFGVPAMLLSCSLQPIMQLDSDRVRVMIAVVVMTLVNILGDIVNVFVIHGGMFGMAMATSVSYFVGLGVHLLHFRKKTAVYRFKFSGINFAILRDILVIGVPTAITRVCNTLRTLVLNNMLIALSGTAAVAALSVQSNMNNLLGALAIGVGSAVLMISGVVVGEEDRTSAKVLVKTALVEGFVLSTILAAVLFVAAPAAVSVYVQDAPETAALAVKSVRYFAFSMPLHVVGMVLLNFLQGSRNTTLANIVTFGADFVLVIVAALALTPLLGTDGVWAAFPVGKALMLPLIFGLAWLFHKRMPKKAEDFLFLSDDFDVPEGNKIEARACEMSHVVEMSEKARNFCAAKGIEDKRAYYVALCIEEMAGNIIRYGFSDGKAHSIDLRLLIKGDELIVRLRDDCQAFDPQKWLSIHEPEDPYANIGIRMVNSIAKSFEYMNTLETNNLLIKL